MNRRPLMSIICPFYQVGPYLAEAIESVLAQSFDNWELILVDDGSSDAGRQIARDYADRHPDRIILLKHPGRANRGISASRNLGAANARGDWIGNLDGDDVLLPDTLSDRARILAAHPEVGLIMGATLYWNSWAGEESPPDALVRVGAEQDRVHEPPRLHEVLYPLGRGTAPSMNTVLVRRDVLQRVGGWEDEFPTAYEDQALLAKLYLATPAYVSSTCWDFYRQRPDSCMHTELVGSAYDVHRRRFLKWFARYLELHGGPAHIQRRTQRLLWLYRHSTVHMLVRGGRRARRLIFRATQRGSELLLRRKT